jgi:uncharacterized protein (TIGR02246 family)
MQSTATEAASTANTEAVHDLLNQLSTAWSANDAEAFTNLFTDDGTVVLPGDVYLYGREAILGFMARAYQGPYRGTGVTGTALSVRFIDSNTSVMITEGGVLAPGETEVAPQRAIRATWVCVNEDGTWKLSAYHNSPINIPT